VNYTTQHNIQLGETKNVFVSKFFLGRIIHDTMQVTRTLAPPHDTS